MVGLEMGTVELITQVGFPVFVALWFMIRTERVINNNTQALTKVLEKL